MMAASAVKPLSTASASASSSSSSPILIRRLILYHPGLLPGSLGRADDDNGGSGGGGPGELDEGASLSELAEHVLYFRDDNSAATKRGRRRRRRQGGRGKDDDGVDGGRREGGYNDDGHATEAAVKFAGLCAALSSLPRALQRRRRSNCGDCIDGGGDGGGSWGDDAEVVHLAHSTLVFVRLEDDDDYDDCLGGCAVLTAVAQIPRRCAGGYGADALAVRTAIRRCHESFALVRGGGVHHRLLSSGRSDGGDGVKEEVDGHRHRRRQGRRYNYPGIPRIYTLRKALRKLEHNLDDLSRRLETTVSNPECSDDYWNDLAKQAEDFARRRSDIEKDLDALLKVHPTTFLRRDLSLHYGAFLSDWSAKCSSIDGGAGRCVVECLPVPVTAPPTTGATKGDTAACYHVYSEDEMHHGGQRPPTAPGVRASAALAKVVMSLLETFGVREECESLIVSTGEGGGERGIQSSKEEGKGTKSAAAAAMAEEELPRLWGLSTFYEGRALFSRVVASSPPPDEGGDASPPSNATACLLLDHLTSHRHRRWCGGSPTTAAGSVSFDDGAAQGGFRDGGTTASLAPPSSATSSSAANRTLDRLMNKMSLGREGGAASAPSKPAPSSLDRRRGIGRSSSSPDPQTDRNVVAWRFLSPPPLSAVDAITRIESASVPLLGRVWIPLVHLPRGGGRGGNDRREGVAPPLLSSPFPRRIALYECGGYGLLLYFSDSFSVSSRILGSHNDDSGDDGRWSEQYSAVLSSVANHLAESFVDLVLRDRHEGTVTHAVLNGGTDRERDRRSAVAVPEVPLYLGEPGQDIVYIDRTEDSLVLMSHRNLLTFAARGRNAGNRGADATASLLSDAATAKTDSLRKSMIKLPLTTKKKKDRSATTHGSDGRSSSTQPSLDCRHLLASHLPLDVMLAFDDMANEIHRRSFCRRRNSGSDNPVPAFCSKGFPDNASALGTAYGRGCGNDIIEICTFLPQGWVYGRSHGPRELYILFDTNTYVTISDVQRAAMRVRRELLGDVLL